jgi:uncharacterized protein (DUF58 family)
VDPARHPRPGARTAVKGVRPRLRGKRGAGRWFDPPRRLRPTRAGWCFFALTLGVGFGALNTGNNLLYLVLSFMLSFLVLSGFLSESALRGVHVERSLPTELFARSGNPVSIRIDNRQRRGAAFAVVVADYGEVDGETRPLGQCFALRVGPGESERRRYTLSPPERGWLALTYFDVSTRFPFGLFTKSLRIPAAGRALVYPHVQPLGTPTHRGSDERSGETHPGAADIAAAISTIREYQHGDPLRRVQWRSSLRRGALIVGELEGERSAEVEVVLRTDTPDDDFEQRVEWAASEVCAHLDAGLRVALRTDHQAWPGAEGRRHRAQLLGFLATAQPGEADESAARDVEPSELAS